MVLFLKVRDQQPSIGHRGKSNSLSAAFVKRFTALTVIQSRSAMKVPGAFSHRLPANSSKQVQHRSQYSLRGAVQVHLSLSSRVSQRSNTHSCSADSDLFHLPLGQPRRCSFLIPWCVERCLSHSSIKDGERKICSPSSKPGPCNRHHLSA